MQLAVEEHGPRDGTAAVLLHGRAPDARALVAAARAQQSLRGFFAGHAGPSSPAVTRAERRGLTVPSVITTGPLTPPNVVQAADAPAALLPDARRGPSGDLVDAVQTVAA